MKKNTTNKFIKVNSGINWEKVDSITESEYDYEEFPEANLEFFKTASVRVPGITEPITK